MIFHPTFNDRSDPSILKFKVKIDSQEHPKFSHFNKMIDELVKYCEQYQVDCISLTIL